MISVAVFLDLKLPAIRKICNLIFLFFVILVEFIRLTSALILEPWRIENSQSVCLLNKTPKVLLLFRGEQQSMQCISCKVVVPQ